MFKMDKDHFYRTIDDVILTEGGTVVKEYASLRGNLTEQEIDKNLSGDTIKAEILGNEYVVGTMSVVDECDYLDNDPKSPALMSDNFLNFDSCSDDEESNSKSLDKCPMTLKVTEDMFKREGSVDLDNGFSPSVSEPSEREPQEILFQVEVSNEDSKGSFVEESELVMEPTFPWPIKKEQNDGIASIMNDHDYISQELSSHISLMTNIKTSDDLKMFLNMLAKFTSEFTLCGSFALKKEEFKCDIEKLLLCANQLKEKMFTSSSTIAPEEKDNNFNTVNNDCNVLIKEEVDKEKCEKEYSATSETLEGGTTPKDGICLSPNPIKNVDDIFYLSDKKNVLCHDGKSNATTTWSRTLREECSEPLEFNQSNIGNIISENSPNQDISPENQTKNISTLRNLFHFGEDLMTTCETLEKNKPENFEEVLNKLYVDFKKIVLSTKITKSTVVQTDHTGVILLSKDKQKRINEKEKKRLLAASSSDSDSNSDDFGERMSEGTSNSYMSSRSTSRNSMISGTSEDENNNYDEDGDKGEYATDKISNHEVPSNDGLNLSKYVTGNDCISQFDTEKTISTQSTAPDMPCNDVNMLNADSETTEPGIIINEIFQENNVHSAKFVDKDKSSENANESNCSEKTLEINLKEDPKLYMNPVVVIDKLTEDQLEDLFDDLQDKEIEKLLDFKNLIKKNLVESHYQSTNDKNRPIKSKKTEKLLEMIKDAEKDMFSDDSCSESENEKITEKQFLEQCNNGYKHKLLNTSSSDSEQASDISDIEDLISEHESESSVSNNSDSPMLNKLITSNSLNSENEIKLEEENNDSSEKLIEELKAGENTVNVPLTETEPFENKNEDTKKISSTNGGKTVNDIKTINDDNVSQISNKSTVSAENNIGDHTENETLTRKYPERSIVKSFKEDEGTSKKIVVKNENDREEPLKKSKIDSDGSDCEILDDDIKKKSNNKDCFDDGYLSSEKKRKGPKSIDDSINLSSDTESDITNEETAEEIDKKSRTIKPMLRQDQLAGETKKAQQQEDQRLKRLRKKKDVLNRALKEHKKSAEIKENSLILDYNTSTKTFIEVHSDIVKKLKPHQFEGVQFMYDSVYGSVDNLQKYPGSGCILAHCMGLGKTLQLIALLHTVISHKELNTCKILVLCPKSTVMNWWDEICYWLGPAKCRDLKLYKFDSADIQDKIRILKEWSSCGKPGYRKAGCLLIGYEAFRSLAFRHQHKKQRNNLSPIQLQCIKEDIQKNLFDPGADLVICDEGHIIKNRKSATSAAVSEIKTPRRIILTGTPIQNNLKEYYSMVNFIKPSFLGTEREFANLYANPIKNGQHKDSSKQDIKVMKQRSFVLHKKLSQFVQRREAALLKTFLPEKYEYVLFIPMTDVQTKLYEYFLQIISKREESKGKSLIPDYTCLRKIWTHPKVLENAWQNANAKMKAPIRSNQSDDEVPDDVFDSQEGLLSVKRDWWRPLISPNDLISILPSNKLRLVFEILRMCEEKKEKCLIFSAFVAVLNVLEYFMNQPNHDLTNNEGLRAGDFKGPWVFGRDYYRLDGKTSKHKRHEMIKGFNSAHNQVRCFLISAKAGGQGINLTGANRVILLDTSWNPSNDQQNIFRIFRLGQKRKCYIYRLLAMGTMEEKVYSRSVTKQAMSFRVVDEQQIDRHYSMAELTELYTLTKPDYTQKPVPILPQDSLLASLLRNFPNLVYKYHEHDSLLENKLEQELSEQEKQDAWEAYERDLQHSQNPPGFFPPSTENLPFPFLAQNAANYLSNFPPFNNYGINAASLLAMAPAWGGLDYSSNAMANMYNMYQSVSAGTSPLLSNQNLLSMQPPYGGNILSSESSPRPFPNVGAFGAINNVAQSTSMMTSPSYGSPLYSTMKTLPAYTSTSTSNDISPLEQVGRYFSNSAFTSQINPTPNTNTASELRVQNKMNLFPPPKSSIATTGPPNVTTAPPTSSSGQSPITSISIGATKTDNTNKGKDKPIGERIKPQTALNNPPVLSKLNSEVQVSSVNIANALRTNPVDKSLIASRGTNIGIVYPENTVSNPVTTTAKQFGSGILTSKSVDIIPSPSQNGNITVRTVNAINNGGTNSMKNASNANATAKNILEKNAQKSMSTLKLPYNTKRHSVGETLFHKQNIAPPAVSVPSTISLNSTNVKRHNNQLSPIKNVVSNFPPTTGANVNSFVDSRKTDIKAQTVSTARSIISHPKTGPRAPQLNAMNVAKPSVNMIAKLDQIDKSLQGKPVNKTQLNTKLISATMGPNSNTTINKQTFSNLNKNMQPGTVVAKQSSGLMKAGNGPTNNNNSLNIMKSTNKIKAPEISNLNLLRSNATIATKNQQTSKISNALGAINRNNDISIRSLENLNKLTNSGITISPGRKINATTNIANIPQSTWKASASRKRSIPNTPIVLPEKSSISIQRIKKPRLNIAQEVERLKTATEPYSRFQTPQGSHVIPRNSSQSNQRSKDVPTKAAEVVEID